MHKERGAMSLTFMGHITCLSKSVPMFVMTV